MKNLKKIGVIGGMGPESTAIYYKALITECQKQYGAQYDSDYPEILIYNLPIPDVVSSCNGIEEVSNKLIKGAVTLEEFGSDFIVMPCNTVHYFYPQMNSAIKIPFICIFLSAAKKIRASGYTKIGFLSTETTLKFESYSDDFARNGIELIMPNNTEQKILTNVILNILAGYKLDSDKIKLKSIIANLQAKGAEAVILACTDLPILINQQDVDIEIFDTVQILAEKTVEFALGRIGDEILE